MASNKAAWIEEFRYQLNLAENIWKSSMPGKGRIAFVLLDNVIEFMSKYYLKVVRKLVGKRKNQMSHSKWHTVSRYFDELMDAMRNHSPVPPPTIDSIDDFHKIRNDLYHTSAPMEVTKGQFETELKNAIETFEILFRESYSSSVIDVDATLHGKPILEDILSVVGNQSIRVIFTGSWHFSQWIRAIIYGYTSLLGIRPSFKQIEHSLAISNQPAKDSKTKGALRKLKHDGDIDENAEGLYSLTSKGLEKTMKQR